MRRHDRSLSRTLLPLLGLLVLAAPAAGQTVTWTGAATTDWNTSGNWSTGAVPNSRTADVTFDDSGAVGTVNVSASVQARSLAFSNPTGNYTLTSSPGQTISGVTTITVGGGVTGTQTID